MNILTVDIGNTNTNCGVFFDGKLMSKFNFPTLKLNPDKVDKELFNSVDANLIDKALICSVVPYADKSLKNILEKKKIRVFFCGKEIKVPVENLYNDPLQVGQDRLVNAYSVIKLYSVPAVIVDFGTAVTFDYINSSGQYEGGLIVPGIKTSLNALIQDAALINDVKITDAKNLIGKDTSASVNSGILNGFGSMADGLIKKIKKDKSIKFNGIIVVTGGDGELIKPYMKQMDIYDADLTLKGLNQMNNFLI